MSCCGIAGWKILAGTLAWGGLNSLLLLGVNTPMSMLTSWLPMSPVSTAVTAFPNSVTALLCLVTAGHARAAAYGVQCGVWLPTQQAFVCWGLSTPECPLLGLAGSRAHCVGIGSFLAGDVGAFLQCMADRICFCLYCCCCRVYISTLATLAHQGHNLGGSNTHALYSMC